MYQFKYSNVHREGREERENQKKWKLKKNNENEKGLSKGGKTI